MTRMVPQPAVGMTTALLALAALGALWIIPWYDGPSSAGTYILATVLAGAIIGAYHYPIHIRHQTKVLLVSVVYYLLAVLVSPFLAALAAGLGAIAGELLRRPYSGAYLSDIATEAGRRVLIVVLAACIAHQPLPWPHPLSWLAAAAVLMLGDMLTAPLVLAPMSGERPLAVLIATVREAAPVESIQYAIGLLGALAGEHHPWALFLLLVPCALAYVSFKLLKEMQDGTRRLLEDLADAVDLRDAYTGGHSRRVTGYCADILRELRLHGPEVDLILAAARVHDIGKIGIPDAVLHKPNSLTDGEWEIMKAHPVTGANLLRRHRDFARGTTIVRHHHERWDGRGYPDSLRGSAIPFGARVIAVADSFDAMTSDRPYRPGMSVERAVEILRAGRSSQWDPAIVDAFLRTLQTQAPSMDNTSGERYDLAS